MVHRPERLSDVLYAMREHGMEPKRLRFVLAGSEAAPSLFLVEGRRGGKSGLVVGPPLVIGSYEWEKVYFR
ncbi:MAG: methyltransferase, partial [Oscillospiraceae bacterium]|nr:methyltransferase [Oscillospiraceae bacterium]